MSLMKGDTDHRVQQVGQPKLPDREHSRRKLSDRNRARRELAYGHEAAGELSDRDNAARRDRMAPVADLEGDVKERQPEEGERRFVFPAALRRRFPIEKRFQTAMIAIMPLGKIACATQDIKIAMTPTP